MTVELWIAAIVALCGAIAALFKLLWGIFGEVKAKLNRCEEEHSSTRDTVTDLSARLARLEGEHSGIERISAGVLEEIRRLKEEE